MSPYPHLLSPGRIGSMELRNRVVLCPMGILLSNADGSVSDTEVAFYEARARGGAGLLLIGTAQVAYPEGVNHPQMQAISDDRYLPGMRRLADAVHAHGSKIAAQLNYMGIYAQYDMLQGNPRVVAFEQPFPNPDEVGRMLPREEATAMAEAWLTPGANLEQKVADEDDIVRIIGRYADAAARCQRAGYDGVEIHAGHGYFIDSFLTPRNQRTDGWGGDLDGRTRVLLTVIRQVREAVGPDYPVWIRLNSREYHHEVGETFDEQTEVARRALAAGVDAIHLTAYANTDVATSATDSYAPHRVQDLPRFAAELRRETGATVITYGRHDADAADGLIADGTGDFVGFARRLLADPDMPRKLADSEGDRVRPCVYQYTCIGNIALRTPVRCAVNPQLGRDAEPLPTPMRARQVLVVGAGPAGLETAIRLNQAGHRVTLLERHTELGGMLRQAAAVDSPLADYLAWLRRTLADTDVELRLGEELSGATARGYDDVVLATGGDWSTIDHPAGALDVPSLASWLEDDDDTVGARVLVLGTSIAALRIAQLCRARGRETTLVSPERYVGPELGALGRHRHIQDYLDAGGHLLLRTAYDAHEVEADTVIDVRPRVGEDNPLVASLRAALPADVRIHVLGDAAGPGAINAATQSAMDLVLALAPAGR